MATIRIMPPPTGSNTTSVNGRTYTCAVGATIDVPDFDARVLSANGWTITEAHGVGATSARPTNPKKDTHFLDTTLGYGIVFDGVAWRNKSTGAAV